MLLVIQFRDDPSEQHEQECIRKHLKKGEKIKFLSVFDKSSDFAGPDKLLKNVDRIILGGSGKISMAKGHPDVNYDFVDHILNSLSPLIKHVVEKDFLCFGTCFGHQIIAKFLGEKVVFDKKVAEAGIYEIFLTEDGQEDRIFSGVSKIFHAVLGHQDSVAKIPKGATHLAFSKKCATQAFRFGKNVYGTQFHGELETDDLIYRLNLFPEYREYADTIDYIDTSESLMVLKNFLKFERL